MKKLLVIFFLSLTICSYSQNGNITVQLISYKVIIKPFNGGITDQYKNYGLDLSGSVIDEGVKNNMGLQLSSQFATNIYTNAISGKLVVYDPYSVEIFASEMKFPRVLTPKEVESSVNWVDTAQIQRPYPPYEIVDTVLRSVFSPEEIVAIEFFETWSINEKTMDIKKKIIAIAPLIARYDGYENFIYFEKLFFVKM